MSLRIETNENSDFVLTVGKSQIEAVETAIELGLLAMKEVGFFEEEHDDLEAFLKALSADIDILFFGSVIQKPEDDLDFKTFQQLVAYANQKKGE